MKAYGFTRRDKLSCRSGCCEMNKGSRKVNAACANRRRARKAARRSNKAMASNLDF